jgi:hypothetical protein
LWRLDLHLKFHIFGRSGRSQLATVVHFMFFGAQVVFMFMLSQSCGTINRIHIHAGTRLADGCSFLLLEDVFTTLTFANLFGRAHHCYH